MARKRLSLLKGENMEDRYLFKAKHMHILPGNDHLDGSWVVGFLSGERYITNDSGEYLVDQSTVCQCTGLKDKNGKLIWENDIVDFLGHRGVIKYECGGFGIGYKQAIDWDDIESNIMRITGCDNILYACENDSFISLWEIYWNFNDEDNCLNTIEVIGNEFDNPELSESEG